MRMYRLLLPFIYLLIADQSLAQSDSVRFPDKRAIFLAGIGAGNRMGPKITPGTLLDGGIKVLWRTRSRRQFAGFSFWGFGSTHENSDRIRFEERSTSMNFSYLLFGSSKTSAYPFLNVDLGLRTFRSRCLANYRDLILLPDSYSGNEIYSNQSGGMSFGVTGGVHLKDPFRWGDHGGLQLTASCHTGNKGQYIVPQSLSYSRSNVSYKEARSRETFVALGLIVFLGL
jgi:hypothetical protein